jgi:hypothetical protein
LLCYRVLKRPCERARFFRSRSPKRRVIKQIGQLSPASLEKVLLIVCAKRTGGGPRPGSVLHLERVAPAVVLEPFDSLQDLQPNALRRLALQRP